MFRRLTNSGLNFMVLVAAIVVFLGAFLALNSLASAQKPPVMTILAAAHDLSIGQVLITSDLVEKTVYVDENTLLYISADQAEGVVGGVVALPAAAGQPLFRSAILASVGEGSRLSAALSKYPEMSLFPLPLEANNIIAPEAATFLPGDLIGITVVIGTRPPPPATPTPQARVFTLPGSLVQELPTLLPQETELVFTTTLSVNSPEPESEEVEALARAAPPLAKDLFPQGVMVIAVQGLPQATYPASAGEDPESPAVFASPPEQKLLVLLVPKESREQLALAMQRADQIFVSLLVRGDGEEITPGFTYWDFEHLFQADREQVLGGAESSSPVANPPVTPALTPTP